MVFWVVNCLLYCKWMKSEWLGGCDSLLGLSAHKDPGFISTQRQFSDPIPSLSLPLASCLAQQSYWHNGETPKNIIRMWVSVAVLNCLSPLHAGCRARRQRHIRADRAHRTHRVWSLPLRHLQGRGWERGCVPPGNHMWEKHTKSTVLRPDRFIKLLLQQHTVRFTVNWSE